MKRGGVETRSVLLLLLLGTAVAVAVCVGSEYENGGGMFDISHRYHPEMPSWESKDGIGQFVWLPKSMKNGSLANNSLMKMPTHTGTHVDAPGHVFDHYFHAGFDVDSLDLHVLNGMFIAIINPNHLAH